jgi:hypothetical protein
MSQVNRVLITAAASALAASFLAAAAPSKNLNNSARACVAAWRPVALGTTTPADGLEAIAAVSRTDVWAVGSYQHDSTQPLIAHWNGSRWSVVSPRVCLTARSFEVLPSCRRTTSGRLAGSVDWGRLRVEPSSNTGTESSGKWCQARTQGLWIVNSSTSLRQDRTMCGQSAMLGQPGLSSSIGTGRSGRWYRIHVGLKVSGGFRFSRDRCVGRGDQ